MTEFIVAVILCLTLWRIQRADEPHKILKRVLLSLFAGLIGFLCFYCWAAGKSYQKVAKVHARSELRNWEASGKPKGSNLWEYAKSRKNAIIGEAWVGGQPQIFIQLTNVAGWYAQISENGTVQILQWP